MIRQTTIGQAAARAERAAAEAKVVEAREREVAARMVVHRRVAAARKEREDKRIGLYQKRAQIDAELRELRDHEPGTDTALAREVAFALWRTGPEYAAMCAIYDRLTLEPPEVTAARRHALREAA